MIILLPFQNEVINCEGEEIKLQNEEINCANEEIKDENNVYKDYEFNEVKTKKEKLVFSTA